jgi:adenylate cyclase
MPIVPESGNIPNPDREAHAELLQLALPISQKVVLVIDVVESVRLMAADEAGTVARWHDFAHTAQTQVIPQHHGRLVKSLGDGLMVEFEQARDAANAAHALHAVASQRNVTQPPERQMHLRAGINATHVYTDNNDIFGAGVNLAARLATLAGPGETVVSASVRDGLTDGLDATVEDLGECYLKHIEQPVRAYRVGTAGAAPVVVAQREYATPLQPTIAVIPFTARTNEPGHFAIGELIADGVIAQLSRTADVRVISRLSSTAFRQRDATLHDIQAHLGATYVLTGSYTGNSKSLLINAELADVRSESVVWAHRVTAAPLDLLDAGSVVIHDIAEGAHRHVVNSEVLRSFSLPLPSLESCTLMLGAIALMHRMTRGDFENSRKMLEHLVARHPNYVVPQAWLAKWYSLAVAQGWSDDAARDTTKALGTIHKALDIDSKNALALTIKALVHGYVEKRFDLAHDTYALALASNPNESLAWIGAATLHTWQGNGAAAVHAAETALALSPMDPMKYYFDSLAATAMLADGKYARAIQLANRSLSANRLFTSTYKVLVMAQFLTGEHAAAKASASALIRVDPTFSVELFKRDSPLFRSTNAVAYCEAFERSGIPQR